MQSFTYCSTYQPSIFFSMHVNTFHSWVSMMWCQRRKLKLNQWEMELLITWFIFVIDILLIVLVIFLTFVGRIIWIDSSLFVWTGCWISFHQDVSIITRRYHLCVYAVMMMIFCACFYDYHVFIIYFDTRIA